MSLPMDRKLLDCLTEPHMLVFVPFHMNVSDRPSCLHAACQCSDSKRLEPSNRRVSHNQTLVVQLSLHNMEK